jgi:hypothetical protein
MYIYQTPEWKKAYMFVHVFRDLLLLLILISFSDYRGLKKQLTLIRKIQHEHQLDQLTREVQEDLDCKRIRSCNGPPLQPHLDYPVKDGSLPQSSGVARVSSVSRRDPINTSPTKRLQTSIHSSDDSPDRDAKLETPRELVPRHVPSLGTSTSVFRQRRASQTTGKQCRLLDVSTFIKGRSSKIIEAIRRSSASRTHYAIVS